MNTESISLYAYQWNYDGTDFHMFGLDENNDTVYVKVVGFTPYVYVELPTTVTWTQSNTTMFANKLVSMLKNKPVKRSLVMKHKLYYVHNNADNTRKTFPYLFMAFECKSHVSQLSWMKPITIPGICTNFNINVHESDASPFLQMSCFLDIPPVGWITINGTKNNNDNVSLCKNEYIVNWKKISKCNTIQAQVVPLIMSFDIECNSSNSNAMPNANKPEDKVFQISLSFSGQFTKNILLSLGNPSTEIVGCEVRTFNTEYELLIGYTRCITEFMPNVIVGYNIFGFDIPYMIARSKHTMCYTQFTMQGFIPSILAKENNISWSSSAFKNQHFEFLDVYGCIFVDLMPIIQRDYKLDNYKLKTIATHLLKNVTKDPLTPNDIFECYRKFTPESLGIVGKYCVQDSVVVSSISCAISLWIGLCEMAITCNVPIFTLYTQGQQVKVYSQVYKYCMSQNIVVEKIRQITDETYTGAYVVDPVPGIYDMVVPFDFASLYPTAIIAYNIDYSTLVIDDSVNDSECHVVEWEDHIGCEHDATKRPKSDRVLCKKYKYKFIKNNLGVIPTIIKNLLDARKRVNAKIKELKSMNASKADIDVLDKRQLSYKVSANSMYGAMGVQRGYLPFMIGAMCTTAMGRSSIIKASGYIKEKYGGHIVYGDTDSTMITFDNVSTNLWDLCVQIEKDVSSIFPSPMRLAFEEKIYKRFMIMTKKRYIALECNNKYELTGKITKKGVILARRDNSKAVRDIYEKVVMQLLNTKEITVDEVCSLVLSLMNRSFSSSNFVITKSIGDVSSYKQHELPSDEVKKAKRLKDLDCEEYEYGEKTLPAHIQLAEKMRKRGYRVDVGSRIEYVITTNGGRLSDKLEEFLYYQKFSTVMDIDYTYYVKLLVNPLDQVLDIVLPQVNIVKKMYKTICLKDKLVNELKNINYNTIVQL